MRKRTTVYGIKSAHKAVNQLLYTLVLQKSLLEEGAEKKLLL